jgi:hypothetical protein
MKSKFETHEVDEINEVSRTLTQERMLLSKTPGAIIASYGDGFISTLSLGETLGKNPNPVVVMQLFV